MWLTLLLRNSAPHTGVINVFLALTLRTSCSGPLLLKLSLLSRLESASKPLLLCMRTGQETYLGDLKGRNKRYDSVLLNWKDSCLKARNCADKTTHSVSLCAITSIMVFCFWKELCRLQLLKAFDVSSWAKPPLGEPWKYWHKFVFTYRSRKPLFALC